MEKWQSMLNFDPLPNLLSSKNQAIVFFAERDLQDEQVSPVEALWELPSAKKVLGHQQPDGSWKYHGEKLTFALGRSIIKLKHTEILENL